MKITETVLRDANQSLIATRMPFADFENILETMDAAGYYSLECWGGATFDSCLRYLKEDPWERLAKIRQKVKKTKLQMLLRGQNLLGYRHYSDDVVRKFVALSVESGIDIIRIFDALNDFRNLSVAMDETRKRGAHAQGTIVYTVSPIHSLDSYSKLGRELEEMGASSVCVKDMAGILGPESAFELVSALKGTVKIPVFLHTHSTTGLAPMTYLKAAEAGCDGIDTAISAFSGGTSQPATESMHYALRELGVETGLDAKKIKSLNDFFRPLKEKYLKNGLLDPYVLGTETDALVYQVPGGMLSNMMSQLKAQNALLRFEEVLKEIPAVRRDLGYPPLVTPMSQMVGTQAVMNVLSGERYKVLLKETKAYIRGEYGKAPGKIEPSLQKTVLGDAEPISGRFSETLEPMLEKAKSEVGNLAKTDREVLSYILFPQVYEAYVAEKKAAERRPVERTIRYSIEAVSREV